MGCLFRIRMVFEAAHNPYLFLSFLKSPVLLANFIIKLLFKTLLGRRAANLLFRSCFLPEVSITYWFILHLIVLMKSSPLLYRSAVRKQTDKSYGKGPYNTSMCSFHRAHSFAGCHPQMQQADSETFSDPFTETFLD